MARYLATMSYIGTNYNGYQKQPQCQTIQSTVEEALSKIMNSEVTIYASGRTDAGVHAHGQTFHFDSEKDYELSKLRYSINCLLPKDIHVISIVKVEDDFHARLSAIAKKYVYRIHQGESDPFLKDTAYQLSKDLDMQRMQEAIPFFLGEHNFQNFTSKEEDERGFTRTIYAFRIEKENNEITITIIGNGFMRYMVRMIVGALVAIGMGKESLEFVWRNLKSPKRQTISYKAPAQGLYLERVYYPTIITNNYHTHTWRCGHAIGSDEEYVLAAIKAGIKVLGFSDHIFYPNLMNEPFVNVRGDYLLLDDYIESLQALKRKYQDQIEIQIGFEAEYYEDYEWYYQDLLKSGRISYLILGQHFIRINGITRNFFFSHQDQKGIQLYRDAVIKGMKTGLYRYVAHPDLYLAGYEEFDDTAKEIAHDICRLASNLDIPLELNMGGLRKGLKYYENSHQTRFLYPHYEFWRIAGQYGCKVIIGIDAHNPKDFENHLIFLALDLVESLKLNLIEKL